MKQIALFCALLLPSVLSKPEGFYHQAYNYKTSSSSYKNNELQRQNEDEGSYSKAGDLEGRVRPKVNSHSQHSEYTNPKLQQQGYEVGDGTSYGQLNAQGGFRSGEFGYNHLGHGGQEYNTGYNQLGHGQRFGESQSNYQSSSSSSSSYGVHSDLRQVTQNLENDLQRELQHAILEQYRRASNGYAQVSQSQMQADLRDLEQELRRNVSMRIQEAVQTRYGNQGIRGANSYTIQDGRLQPTANYNNQELEDITRNLQNNLVRNLEQQMQQTYSHTSSVTTQRTVIHHPEPIIVKPSPIIQERPTFYYPTYPDSVSVNNHGESLTTIATRVQTDLNEHLNRILDETKRRYFTENTYNPNLNMESITAQLQQELRSNISQQLQNEVRRQYGFDTDRRRDDIDSLQRQIETNLLSKLNAELTKQRSRYLESRSQVYATHRPVHIYYPSNNYVQEDVSYGQREDLSHIQRQVQQDMSRQLQAAMQQQQNSHYNPQVMLQQLTAELNSNLTRQLEQYSQSQQSSGYEGQMADLRAQLQRDLMKQLQQGVQQYGQSYSSYSSWSSSSSSNNQYRPARGFDPSSNNQYRPARGFDPIAYQTNGNAAVGLGEDCGGINGDPNPYRRNKRYSTPYHRDSAEIADDDLVQRVEDIEIPEDLVQKVENEDLYQRPTQVFSAELLQDPVDVNADLHQLSQHSENLNYAGHFEVSTQPNEELVQSNHLQSLGTSGSSDGRQEDEDYLIQREVAEPQPIEEPVFVRRTVPQSGYGRHSASYSRGGNYRSPFEVEFSSKPVQKPIEDQELVDDSFLSSQVHVDPLDDNKPETSTPDDNDLSQHPEEIDLGTLNVVTTTEQVEIEKLAVQQVIPAVEVAPSSTNNQNLDGPAIAQQQEDQFMKALVHFVTYEQKRNETSTTEKVVQNEASTTETIAQNKVSTTEKIPQREVSTTEKVSQNEEQPIQNVQEEQRQNTTQQSWDEADRAADLLIESLRQHLNQQKFASQSSSSYRAKQNERVQVPVEDARPLAVSNQPKPVSQDAIYEPIQPIGEFHYEPQPVYSNDGLNLQIGTTRQISEPVNVVDYTVQEPEPVQTSSFDVDRSEEVSHGGRQQDWISVQEREPSRTSFDETSVQNGGYRSNQRNPTGYVHHEHAAEPIYVQPIRTNYGGYHRHESYRPSPYEVYNGHSGGYARPIGYREVETSYSIPNRQRVASSYSTPNQQQVETSYSTPNRYSAQAIAHSGGGSYGSSNSYSSNYRRQSSSRVSHFDRSGEDESKSSEETVHVNPYKLGNGQPLPKQQPITRFG